MQVCEREDVLISYDHQLLMDESFASSISSSSTRISLHENRPVSCWDEDDYEICVAPVLVCTQVRQTAGGGDNIIFNNIGHNFL
jgi:ADP-dependent glucokinase